MSQPDTNGPTEQPEFLFFGLDKIDRAAPRYHATGKLVAKHRPEVYRIAVDLLAAGKHSRREMCDLLHVSSHTLESIEQEESQTLATLRAQAARRNLRLHHLSLDRLEELIPTMQDGAKVAVVAGIVAEKSQLFAGEATARIERIEPITLVERFAAFVQELGERVTARLNGAEAEKMPTKAAVARILDHESQASPVRAQPSGLPSETDSQSDVTNRFTQGEPIPIDNPIDESAASAPSARDPGRGGIARGGRGPSAMDKPA